MSKRKRTGQQSTPSSFWSEWPERYKHLTLGFLMFLVPLIMFWNVVVGDQKFYAHDTVQWRAAAENVIEAREDYDYEPLWVQSMYGGMPAYFVSYTKSAWNLDDLMNRIGRAFFPAGFMWIGLAGLYVLFILMGANPLSACFGALGVALTTYIPIIIGAGHNTKFIAYNYIPWIMVGYVMLTRRQKLKWLGLGVFALALTAELRSGHPQVTYYFGIFMIIWWIYDGVRAFMDQKQADFLKKTGLLTIAAILGLIAVVQPYWSKTEMTPYSTRGGSEIENTAGLNLDYAMAWSQGWGELMTLAIPNAYGGSSMEGTYWGPKSFTSGPHYMGALTFLLFLYGMVRWKHEIKWLFFGGGVLTMLFALGNEFLAFNRLMYLYVPYFNKFRTPEMWLIVTVFAFTVIAVFGLNTLFRNVKQKEEVSTKEWGVLGAVIGFALLMSIAPGTLLDFQKDGERNRLIQQVARQNSVSPQNPQVGQRVDQYLNNQVIPQRKEKAASDARRFLLLVGLGAGVIFAVRYRKIAPAYAGMAIVLITAYDMTSVGERYISEDSKAPDYVDGEQILQQRERPVDSYIVENKTDSSGTWEYRTFPLMDSPYNTAVPSYFYPTVGGYTAVKLSIYQDLIDETLDVGQGQLNTKVLSMLNTKYLTYQQPIQLPGFEVAFQDQSGVVMENTNVLPKAWFVDSLVVKTDANNAIQYLNNDAFNPAKIAIVEEDTDLNPGKKNAQSQVTRYEPRDIEIQTSNDEEGFLVIGEIYYPAGWEATIDGEAAKIHKTNYVLRGIRVPSGDHTILLSFNPTSHTLGSTLAWIGNGLVLALFAGGIFMTIRRNEEDPTDDRSSQS